MTLKVITPTRRLKKFSTWMDINHCALFYDRALVEQVKPGTITA